MHNPTTDQLVRRDIIERRKRARFVSDMLRLGLFALFCAVMLAVIVVTLVITFNAYTR